MDSKIDTSKLAYKQSSIDEILQCSLCLDRFIEPRALPCQHVFCTNCLKSISTGMKTRRTLTCPLCRRLCPFKTRIEFFPISYVHQQLLEMKPINFDVTSRCAKCYQKEILHPCLCCEYLLCSSCIENDRDIFRNHCENYHQTCLNLNEQLEQFAQFRYPLPIDQITLDSIRIELTQITNDLKRKDTLTFAEILEIWKNLVKIKNQLDQQNHLPVTMSKRPHDFDDDDLIYVETIPAPSLTVNLCANNN